MTAELLAVPVRLVTVLTLYITWLARATIVTCLTLITLIALKSVSAPTIADPIVMPTLTIAPYRTQLTRWAKVTWLAATQAPVALAQLPAHLSGHFRLHESP